MTSLTADASRDESAALRTGVWLMSLGAVAFIGYAVIFFIRIFTDSFLELGIGSGQVDVGVAGFIAATGLAAALLAWFGVRRGYMWAWASAVAVPVLGLAVALPSHYPYGFDTIGHLGLIYLATAIFVVGALVSLKGLTEQSE